MPDADTPRAEQAQPSGYTPPAVGAPTWPQDDRTARIGAVAVVTLADDLQHLEGQIAALALILTEEFGGPTRSESACEMAVRVLRELRADRDRLRAALPQRQWGLQNIADPDAVSWYRDREEADEYAGIARPGWRLVWRTVGPPIAIGAILDLLAAEGRLCEPGEAWPHYFSTYCIHGRHADCRLTCKICPEPCRCTCHVEQGSPPNVTSEPPHRSDSAEPLIDPDCRAGKHSSCVGGPCECPECEHPR